MNKKIKSETLPENIVDKGKQVFLNKSDLVGDNPNKMVIGSGTSFRGSDINTDYIEIYGKVETSIHSKIIYVGTAAEIIGPITCDHIEIHGSVSGGIQVNGKVTIKKSATVVLAEGWYILNASAPLPPEVLSCSVTLNSPSFEPTPITSALLFP